MPQTQFALPLRLGQPQAPRTQPGLYVKAPFIDNDHSDRQPHPRSRFASQEVIASDQKRLVVDAFARYRVTDPLKFYQTLGLDHRRGASPDQHHELGGAPGPRPVELPRRRPQQARRADGAHQGRVQPRGDRLRRPRQRCAHPACRPAEANSQAVFERMKTERQREAAQFRAQGGEQAQRIRAEADRTVARITGEANGSAETVRGSADAERNRIFADAYSRDPEFFDFFRSIQAYTDALKPAYSRFLLSPDSEFFRYFRGPGTSSIKPGQQGQTSGQAPGTVPPPTEPPQTRDVGTAPPAAAAAPPPAPAPAQAPAPPQ